MNPRPKFWFNILLLGDTKTGKTNLIRRLQNQPPFDWDNTAKLTQSTEYIAVNYQINKNDNLKLLIWDSPGKDIFRSNAFFLYKGIHCFFVVYDTTNRKTFNDLEKWFQEITTKGKDGAVMILLGNKCDLEEKRQVSYEEGRALAEEKGMMFFEVSAKTSEGVRNCLETMAKELYNDKIEDGMRARNSVGSNSKESSNKTLSICSCF